MGPSTQRNQTQREIPLLAHVEKPAAVEDSLIGSCDTFLDSILLCVQLSRFTHTRIRDKLGIDKGHWSRILQGQAYFPTNKLTELMQICRNLAPLQWLAHAAGIPLVVDRKEQRRAELLRELAILEGGQSTTINAAQRVAA